LAHAPREQFKLPRSRHFARESGPERGPPKRKHRRLRQPRPPVIYSLTPKKGWLARLETTNANGETGNLRPSCAKNEMVAREIFNRLRQLRRNSLFALEQGIPGSKTGNEHEICSEFEKRFNAQGGEGLCDRPSRPFPFIAKPNPACAASTAMATASLVAAPATAAAKVKAGNSSTCYRCPFQDSAGRYLDQRKESAVAFLFASSSVSPWASHD
jgi:hypothetical protein